MIQIILLDNGVRVANIDYPNNHLVFGIERTNIIEIFDSGKKVVSAPYTEFINELGQPFLTPESVITTLELSYLNLVSQEELDVETADRIAADTVLSNRTTILENNEYKITYYEIISGASGSLTVPSQATINADEFGLSGNAILSKIDGSNKPTFQSPTTSGGVVVTASLNTTTGAWTASGTYTDANVALIYSIKIKAVNYGNLDYDFIIETIEIDTGVQSVTGPQVDDTDPLNPIVEQLGLIQIVDLAGELFTDLATAHTYLSNYLTAPIISNESYSNGIYFFNLALPNLITAGFLNNTSAYIVDRYGLINSYQQSFDANTGNNVLTAPALDYGNGLNTIYFVDGSFNGATGINVINGNIKQNSIGQNFATGSTGKFILNGNIGIDETANYTNFFTGSTATILVPKEKYTSNAGGINGNLQSAITSGCNVQFDGIDLATIPNLALKSPIASPTFTGTVTTPTIIVSGETANTTPIFNASKQIASSIMVDLSATLTIVGWSSFTTKQITKIDCGSYNLWDIMLDGTSNSTTTTVALSDNTNAASTIGYKAIVVVDNGGAVSATGVMNLTPGSNLVTFTRNLAQNNFTASGRKLVIAQFTQMK